MLGAMPGFSTIDPLVRLWCSVGFLGLGYAAHILGHAHDVEVRSGLHLNFCQCGAGRQHAWTATRKADR